MPTPLNRALMMRTVDRYRPRREPAPLLPETKICAACGEGFERPTHTRDGRRYLRQPQQWRTQRFCSADCMREYRLRSRLRLLFGGVQAEAREVEALPPYLVRLEPERGKRA